MDFQLNGCCVVCLRGRWPETEEDTLGHEALGSAPVSSGSSRAQKPEGPKAAPSQVVADGPNHQRSCGVWSLCVRARLFGLLAKSRICRSGRRRSQCPWSKGMNRSHLRMEWTMASHLWRVPNSSCVGCSHGVMSLVTVANRTLAVKHLKISLSLPLSSVCRLGTRHWGSRRRWSPRSGLWRAS